MNHTETLTRYVANFVDELYKSGLTDVVISPGSRSTPLAMTFAEHPKIKHWVNMDERSAAFFALGMAKQQQKAVAILCTSGTAAANYYPAIVESYYSRVPILVLTADRPHELRDVGAPQAINQINLYGEYVKWFHDMALPESTAPLLHYVRSKGARALSIASMGNQGPVHLNFPFREPLIPDFTISNLWGQLDETSFYPNTEGKRRLDKLQLDSFLASLSKHEKGLIVCGPQADEKLAERITELAGKYNLPILADPLSQLRAGQHNKENVIESYDAILKSDGVRKRLKPDFILRFGAMPVSKPYLFYVREHAETTHYIVESEEGYREPTGTSTHFIYAEPAYLCEDMINHKKDMRFDDEWIDSWTSMNETAKQHLSIGKAEGVMTEGNAVEQLITVIPDKSTIYVGNSMPVRDLDTFFMTSPKHIRVLGNRGANGIDGMTSSALGAASHGERVTLLLGDLSFFHDFNGLLLAKQYNINLTILLINNNGGGIFSFLPQVNHTDHFEALFGTPLDIDFEKVISVYNGKYSNPSSYLELEQALTESYQQSGLSVIEVNTEREENVKWHKAKWTTIEEQLLKQLEG